jgi:hypothetical protein
VKCEGKFNYVGGVGWKFIKNPSIRFDAKIYIKCIYFHFINQIQTTKRHFCLISMHPLSNNNNNKIIIIIICKQCCKQNAQADSAAGKA